MDLLTIGDISIDLYLRITEAEVSGKRISFEYGDKVPVEEFRMTVAGNSANVASGGAKLGLESAIYTEAGNDLNADFALEELEKRGINTECFVKNKKAVTDVHPIIVFEGERTILSHHTDRTYKMRSWPTPKILYYTSMSEGFEGFQGQLLEYLRENENIIFVMNPGSRMIATNIDAVKQCFSRLDILFVNKEEAQKLIGNHEDVNALHRALAEMGVKVSVITDSLRGSTVFDGKKVYELGVCELGPKIDATGAGDAYASGFISAIFYKKPILEAMKWGTINAAGEITKVGTGEGLKTKDEIENLASSVEFSK